jgi:ComF family protein
MEADYVCAGCHTPFVSAFPLDEAGLCMICRNGMRGFDSAYSFGFYDGPLQRLIHLMKYEGVYTLAEPLGRRLVRALPRHRPMEAIVPVPMHWRRRWHRGFNQAELLARALSARCGLPVLAGAVIRRSQGPAQAGLSDHERRHNVRASFAVTKPELVRGRHLLLVDDVLTTGATASACGAALKRAGAAGVTVLTLARADRRFSRPAKLASASSTPVEGWS